MEKNIQEKFMNMFDSFSSLSQENKIYVSGIIKGMAIQKESNSKITQAANN